MAIDQALPGQEFLDGQSVALTRFLNGDEAHANAGNDFRFPADDPAFGVRRGQVVDAHGVSMRCDDAAQKSVSRLRHVNSTPLSTGPIRCPRCGGRGTMLWVCAGSSDSPPIAETVWVLLVYEV